jgi:hypothetical protein
MKTRYTNVWLAMTLAGCTAIAGAVEPTATLQQLEGRVFVNQSAAMSLAQEGTQLYPGDRVVAVAGSSGNVVYPDGCTVAMPENSMLLIGCAPQCRAGLAVVRGAAGWPMGGAAGSAMGGAAGFQMGSAAMTALGVGAVATVAGVGAYQFHKVDDNHNFRKDNPSISQ